MTEADTGTGTETGTRAGFVAVLGAPNVGKSTLVNRLVGAKVAIVSPRVQTTRSRLRGIRVLDEVQIVFVDTPGIFEARRRFERAMVHAAWSGAGDADAILLLIDARRGMTGETRAIVDRLRQTGREALVALNKIDLVPRRGLLPLAAAVEETGLAADIFMVSALAGDGVDDLLAVLKARMPRGPWLYPEDQLTDISERLLAAEITREQLFLQLRQELPYAVAVETEGWTGARGGAVEQVLCAAGDAQGHRPRQGRAADQGDRELRRSWALDVQRARRQGHRPPRQDRSWRSEAGGGDQGDRHGGARRARTQILGTRSARSIELFVKVRQRDHPRPEDPERYRDIGLAGRTTSDAAPEPPAAA